ncbi:MAG: hypothetical protein WA715_27005, partial [Candidatus Acidiferrum sp.]
MLITDEQVKLRLQDAGQQSSVLLAASGFVTGSRTIDSAEVDRAFGMPIGKLRSRAGIESLAYAADDENEITLSANAARQALTAASCPAEE